MKYDTIVRSKTGRTITRGSKTRVQVRNADGTYRNTAKCVNDNQPTVGWSKYCLKCRKASRAHFPFFLNSLKTPKVKNSNGRGKSSKANVVNGIDINALAAMLLGQINGSKSARKSR